MVRAGHQHQVALVRFPHVGQVVAHLQLQVRNVGAQVAVALVATIDMPSRPTIRFELFLPDRIGRVEMGVLIQQTAHIGHQVRRIDHVEKGGIVVEDVEDAGILATATMDALVLQRRALAGTSSVDRAAQTFQQVRHSIRWEKVLQHEVTIRFEEVALGGCGIVHRQPRCMPVVVADAECWVKVIDEAYPAD